jgi:hypothetical protein
LLGGAIFEAMGQSFQGYLVIFALSSLLRTLTISLLLPAAGSVDKPLIQAARRPAKPKDSIASGTWPHRDAS